MASAMLQRPFRYRRELLAAAALAAIALVVFLPALRCPFIDCDDPDYVTRNPHVKAGLNAEGASWAFTTFTSSNWHPLTWLSLQLDASVWGAANPGGFHLTNVLLHAANSVLVFLALRALTGACWRSACVALLFAVHPLRVESVAWISERKDVLSAFFGLLALLAYASYARRPTMMRYLLVAMALALGLLCKPMLVTLPCLLLVLDWWPLQRASRGASAAPAEPASKKQKPLKTSGAGAVRTWRPLLLEKLPLFALVVISAAVTYRAQHEQSAVKTLQFFPLATRIENAAVGYAAYLRMTVWPANLAIYYPHPIFDHRPGGGLSTGVVAGAALLLLALTVGALALRRRAPYLLAGWLWYLGTLVPVIGIIQVGDQAYADRYTYLPQIGVLMAICWGVADLAGNRANLALVAGAATALALAAATRNQLAFWQDSVALWSHTLLATFSTATGEMNLGVAYEAERRYAEAEQCYRKALDYEPGMAQTHVNMGNILFIKKEFAEALRHLQIANKIAPDQPDILCNLARMESMQQGGLDTAVAHLRRTLKLKPDYVPAHLGLGLILLQQRKLEESGLHLREALHGEPASATAHDALGSVLEAQGDSAGAAREYEKAVELDSSVDWYRRHLQLIRTPRGPAAKPSGAAPGR